MENTYVTPMAYDFCGLGSNESFLKEDPAPFRVDRDFEVIKKKIDKARNLSETEKLDRLRKSKLENAANKYVIDKRYNKLHDRKCSHVKDIPDEYFEMSETYVHNMRTCKNCRNIALIRKCVKRSEDIKPVEAFFNKMNAEYQDIYNLCKINKIKIRPVTSKVLELKVKVDRWRIEISADGYYRTLLHNNYIIEDYRRIMQPGFHIHVKQKHVAFSEMVKIMTSYQTNYHVDQLIKQENDELEMAPENDIGVPRPEELFNIPNVARLKKIKIFYDRYIYIDTDRNFGETVFEKRRIKAKQIDKVTSNRIKYTVVICDIPKWHRNKIFSTMCEIKYKMWKAGFRDTYVCSLAMLQYLDKKKIKYTTHFRANIFL